MLHTCSCGMERSLLIVCHFLRLSVQTFPEGLLCSSTGGAVSVRGGGASLGLRRFQACDGQECAQWG